MRATAVSMDGVLAGRLSESPAGVEFRYEPTWLANPNAVAVSLHLPLRSAPYQWPRLPPCFTNLLPEGWLLDLSLAKLKIAPEDQFGLLVAVCRDCVGAVEIGPMVDDRP